MSGSLLGLSASGSASITDNQGDVSLSGNLNVNFLNIVNLAFSGNYDSNGSFSFTAAAGFSLTWRASSAWASKRQGHDRQKRVLIEHLCVS